MSSKKPCKYVLNGEKCPFGKRCRFLHQFEGETLKNQQTRTADQAKAPTVHETNPPDFCPDTSTRSEGDQQSELLDRLQAERLQAESDHSKRTRKKPPVCRFYLQHGICRFGTKCRYLHIGKSPVQGSGKVDTEYTENVKGSGMKNTVKSERTNSPKKQKCTGTERKSSGEKLERVNMDEMVDRAPACDQRRDHPPPLTQACDQRRDHPPPQTRACDQRRDHPPPLTQACDQRRDHPPPQTRACDQRRDHPPPQTRACDQRRDHPPPQTRACDQRRDHPPPQTRACDQRRDHPPPLTLASFIGGRPHVPRPHRASKTDSNHSLREVEVEQLRARYPAEKCTLLSKSHENIGFQIEFQPTDQEWNGPAVLILEISFPSSYPNDYCQVKLSTSQDLDSDAIASGNQVIEHYWKPGMLGQLMLRPFLHWWDKNLVDILQTPFSKPASGHLKECSDPESSDDEEEDVIEENSQPSVKSKRGTEIRFVGIDLSQNLGTAYWTTIKIVLSCERCKNHQEAEVKEEKLYSVICGRCNNNMCVIYHLALIHSASSTLGYLELTRCTPVDVVFQRSPLTITCLNCCCEVTSQGFSIGQPKDVYCHRCHSKITLSAGGVKFIQHQRSEELSRGNAELVTVKLSSKKKDILKDGEPLPEYGVCQHYKKSHRWLRFPCCGRAFPCDVCHDSVQDHPMEYATKMICGYCSKEQGYSGKGNCARCGADLISSKHSAHWEGGQGCRNKTKMSRLDKQKYRNTDVKTVCKKSERVGKK